MNLQSMDYIITTAREKSITKAARKLNITQQTLSAHISALEDELGSKLFIRHIPLELTYSGKEFLKYAINIQNQVKNLRRTFNEISGEERGILKIGVTHMRGNIILPPIIMDFQRKHHGINLNVIESANDVLAQKLREGEVDVCISDFSSYRAQLNMVDLYKEKLVFIIKKDLFLDIYGNNATYFASKLETSSEYKVLEGCPLLVSPQQDISGRFARKIMESFDCQPIIKAEASNVELLLRLCVSGLGGLVCPEIILRNVLSPYQIEDLFVFGLGPDAEYNIRIGWKDEWKIINSFIDSAKSKISASQHYA